MASLTSLVELIARSLVDHPDRVRVEETERDGRTLLRLEVSLDDRGKIIGRNGRTVRSIRSLLSAAGARRRRRVHLEILE
jgi:predicted RNA-binding protein YlqC (UPF0109 family)